MGQALGVPTPVKGVKPFTNCKYYLCTLLRSSFWYYVYVSVRFLILAKPVSLLFKIHIDPLVTRSLYDDF